MIGLKGLTVGNLKKIKNQLDLLGLSKSKLI